MYEIIHVVDPESGSGSLRQNLEIEAVDGQPLAAGYYFVLWPVGTRQLRGGGKRYFGPFATRAEARLVQTSAMALGLVGGEPLVQKIAECRSIGRRAPTSANPMPMYQHPSLRQRQTIARAA